MSAAHCLATCRVNAAYQVWPAPVLHVQRGCTTRDAKDECGTRLLQLLVGKRSDRLTIPWPGLSTLTRLHSALGRRGSSGALADRLLLVLASVRLPRVWLDWTCGDGEVVARATVRLLVHAHLQRRAGPVCCLASNARESWRKPLTHCAAGQRVLAGRGRRVCIEAAVVCQQTKRVCALGCCMAA